MYAVCEVSVLEYDPIFIYILEDGFFFGKYYMFRDYGIEDKFRLVGDFTWRHLALQVDKDNDLWKFFLDGSVAMKGNMRGNITNFWGDAVYASDDSVEKIQEGDSTIVMNGVGRCHGSNDELSSEDLNNNESWTWTTCWSACLVMYPDDLVAIDGVDKGVCDCQNTCPYILDCGDEHASMMTRNDFDVSIIPCGVYTLFTLAQTCSFTKERERETLRVYRNLQQVSAHNLSPICVLVHDLNLSRTKRERYTLTQSLSIHVYMYVHVYRKSFDDGSVS